MEFILSMLVGISLSATSGFRVFVPLLILSMASLAGWVELSPAFAWIGTYPALAAFLIATFFELAAYFFPFVDNILGAIATPISIIAGAMITAAVMIDLHPMLVWALAIVVGGGAALGGSAVSNALHTGSSAVTGGTVNPILSLVETVVSVFFSFVAVLIPVLAFLLLAIGFYLVFKGIGRLAKTRHGNQAGRQRR